MNVDDHIRNAKIHINAAHVLYEKDVAEEEVEFWGDIEKILTEYKTLKNELKTYKKALEFACVALDNNICTMDFECRKEGKCPECIRDFFLQKARGEE